LKRNYHLWVFAISGIVFILIGCLALYLLGPVEEGSPYVISEETAFTEYLEDSMKLTSTAFSNNASIPVKYSCKGEDLSPALIWTDPPAGTRSFALIMDDPDAPMGTWVHWVLFNLPATARDLPEGMPVTPKLKDGSTQGTTSARSVGYHGPCPPSGTHRYYFKLYALDITLALTSDANKEALLEAMEGHILAQIELMGTFSK
jgi:Raf kinase inhibitor-like YbhB/YbcL family protein